MLRCGGQKRIYYHIIIALLKIKNLWLFQVCGLLLVPLCFMAFSDFVSISVAPWLTKLQFLIAILRQAKIILESSKTQYQYIYFWPILKYHYWARLRRAQENQVEPE